ncbi:MAG: enhanced entry protein [Gammaproteobacteria bacterium]
MICKRIIIYLAIVFSLLTFSLTLANSQRAKAKSRFPAGCRPIGYKFDFYNVIFDPSTIRYSQTVYFIKNISNRPVYLLQSSNGSEPYILYSNGLISPNKWSVLSVSEDQVKYICTNFSRANREHRVINCQNVLSICEFSRSRFGTNHRGTYWLTMNKARKTAVNITRFHGILLSDPRQIEAQIKNEMGDDLEE